MKRFVPSLLLLTLLASAANAQPTIFIVRHAEKQSEKGNDPELSAAGKTRAQELAKMLSDAGITNIYATEFKRTQETAAPLAQMLGIAVTTVPGKENAVLVSKLNELKGNALVVGHSNTIPALIKALGVTTPIEIGEKEYGNLFLVVPGETPRLIRLHFGQAPSS